jgi:hypothetical protein
MVPVSDETLSPHPPDLRRLRTHGVEALDATGRDDGTRHARSRLRHEGQWRAIRKAYGLKWSRETSCVHAVKHVESGAFGAECGITFGGFASRKAKLFIQT